MMYHQRFHKLLADQTSFGGTFGQMLNMKRINFMLIQDYVIILQTAFPLYK